MLKKELRATASIFKYFPKLTNKLDAYRDLQTMLNYLKSDGIDEERINFQIGFEDDDEKTEFWIVPAGAAQPPSELLNTKPEILDAAKLKRKIVELSKK